MKAMYYGDKKCIVLAEYDDKVVIRLDIGYLEFDSNDYYEPNFSECVEAEIIVDKKHIYKKPISMPDIIKESQNMLNKIKKEKNIIDNEISLLKKEANKEIEEIKRKAQKFEGLETFYDYLNGDIKWVVIQESWRSGIEELDKCMGSYNSKELAAVSFRKQSKQGIIEMYIQEYSDISGGKYLVKGFKELQDAKNYYIELIKNKKIEPGNAVNVCEKYGLIVDEVEQYKKEKIEADKVRDNKEIEKLNEKIKEIKERTK